MASTVYRAYEVDMNSEVSKAMAAAGKEADDESKDLKERAKKDDSVGFKKRGPPCLRVWLATVKELAQVEGVKEAAT
eukprot:12311219-Alexandrium_andersonii.AAC.1